MNEILFIITISGAFIFDFLYENGMCESVCSPEFKKKIIIIDACNLTVEKGNISFNTAIKRTIANMESKTYCKSQIKEEKKSIDAVLNMINPLIEFYLKNEDYFIAKFLEIKK